MRDWEKLARACRRYLDAYNDEIADDVTLGSVGNDLRIIAIREVLPDSETEWGWKPDPDEPDEVICATDEQAARERVSRASYRKLARREVGPWVEVTS